ncbi:MAG: ABC transporter permease [Vicinamibacterales bacterium]
MLRWIKTRLTSLFRRGRLEQDLDRELAFHIDMLTEQNLRAGMPQSQARAAARARFGQVEGVKDAVRDTWMSRTFETFGQDIRYGLRNIRRNPGFALVVIMTMALGIGANTGIFSVVNGVLLRPLPYADGDRLVVLHQGRPLSGDDDIGFSATEIADYRAQTAGLEGVAEFHSMWFILLGRSEPERISTGVVSANFFELLGVQPLYGRAFAPGDDEPGAPAVLVLSNKYWRRAFGGDPSVVGRVFQMNDRPHQVIGVLPAVPAYPEEVDVYMPTSACPFRSSPRARENRDFRMMRAFGRLRSGVTLSKARADLAIVADHLQKDFPKFYPANQGYQMAAIPMQEESTRSFQTTLYVLLGTAGFVLLIVCASIANLTLARMVRRQREMSVRAALGAGRARLLRQLLTESTLLAVLGGVLGLVLASWSLDLLILFAERFTTRAAEISIDRAVLLYALGLSVGTGLVFGSVPAFAGRLGSTPGLKDGVRATQASHGLRSSLIVVQVAVSFMLLIGAGLTARTLFNLQRVDPGFRTDDILTSRLDLNFTKYKTFEQKVTMWERLEDRLRSMPGVVNVGGAGTFPLNEQGPFSTPLRLETEQPGNAARPRVDVQLVTPDYFTTLGQPLVEGRVFTRSDRGKENGVAIVNRTMARHYWLGQSAIGRRISGDDGETWVTVVGIVADTRQQLNLAPTDEVYLPMFQSGQLSSSWLVRSTLDATTLERQVRQAVYAVDPNQPVHKFRTLEVVRLSTLESPRVTATLIGLFALLALVITATGIAGVIAFSVNQRTQEFGVRMALGAPRASVLTLVLRQGLTLVVIGLAIGMAGALVLTRVMTTLLFGVEPTDALTFLAVSMVLVGVAAVACLVPARRAASVDPMVALRVS